MTGLIPNTSYLFILVATNSDGTSHGLAYFFTTAQTSCASDRENITTDFQSVSKDRSTIAAQKLVVASDLASLVVSSTTIAQDQATIAQDEVTVITDEKSVAGATLTALISGTVTAVNNSVGQTVGGSGSSTATSLANSSSSSSSSSSSGSSTFIEIQNLGKLEVVANFAEADASKIAVGQTATVTLSALSSTAVSGVVTAVSPTSTVVSNVVTYPVTVSLTNPPSTVKQGMTSQVSIVVQTATNVLELPSAAITTLGNTSTVKVLDSSGKQITTSVTLGLVGSSYTEIVSGLSEGQEVVEPTAIVSGPTNTLRSTGGGFGGGGFPGGAP
ncbi:MAG TPA: efflux RND transporter periplasmic adaptor subunit [Acidimicrobiales bacterium]